MADELDEPGFLTGPGQAKRTKRGKGGGKGAPRWEPSEAERRTIMVLASCGASHRMIATRFGVSESTLERRCAAELESGLDRIMAELGVALVRQGLKGNVNAIKYFMMTRGGPAWQIVEGRRLSGDPDAPPLAFSATTPQVVIVMPNNGRVTGQPPVAD